MRRTKEEELVEKERGEHTEISEKKQNDNSLTFRSKSRSHSRSRSRPKPRSQAPEINQ